MDTPERPRKRRKKEEKCPAADDESQVEPDIHIPEEVTEINRRRKSS